MKEDKMKERTLNIRHAEHANHVPCHPELVSGSSKREVLVSVETPFTPRQQMLKQVQHDIARGFTLAEVLITLAIIGVVAALTIPSVVRNYQKQQTVVRLKKIYLTLNQAYNNSQAENGSYESWDDSFTAGPSEYFKNYIKPYMKMLKVCETYQECNYQTNFPWQHARGTAYGEGAVSHAASVSFITTDGIFVNMRTTGGSGASETFVRVDLNVEKEPNRLGRDVFVFRRTNKGILLECYNNAMDNINSNCSKTGAGTCCAAKIARDGWEIRDDYPW